MFSMDFWCLSKHNRCFITGDISGPYETVSASFSFSSITNYREDFSTGYYLPAGQKMSINILNDEGDDTWTKFEVRYYVISNSINHAYYLVSLKVPRGSSPRTWNLHC